MSRLLALLCCLLSPASHAAAAVSPPGSCVTFGCTNHKADGDSCQCNFHCTAHSDCCSDHATVCANQTAPVHEHHAGEHSAAAAAPANSAAAHTPAHAAAAGAKATNNTNGTAAAAAHGKGDGHGPKAHTTTSGSGGGAAPHGKGAGAPAGQGAANRTKAAGAQEGKGSGSSGKGKGSGEVAKGGKGAGDAAKGGKGSGDAAKGGGGKGSGEAAKGGGGKGSGSGDANAELKAIRDGSKAAKGDKPKAHTKHGGKTWTIVVILACATGLTLPVTVAIILVLRARGVCCAKQAFHRIDRPPPKSANTSAVDSMPPTPAGIGMLPASDTPFPELAPSVVQRTEQLVE